MSTRVDTWPGLRAPWQRLEPEPIDRSPPVLAPEGPTLRVSRLADLPISPKAALLKLEPEPLLEPPSAFLEDCATLERYESAHDTETDPCPACPQAFVDPSLRRSGHAAAREASSVETTQQVEQPPRDPEMGRTITSEGPQPPRDTPACNRAEGREDADVVPLLSDRLNSAGAPYYRSLNPWDSHLERRELEALPLDPPNPSLKYVWRLLAIALLLLGVGLLRAAWS